MSLITPQIFNQRKHTYKRLFLFGCSFTVYHWPTWANILHYDMPQAKYYNFAKGGGGNFYIYAQIMAAHQKYNFTKDDCIAVLWSTHGREDRYLRGSWLTPGNIWTQGFYDDDFVKEFACIQGYIVRDLAIFKGAKMILDSLPSDALNMYSVPIDYNKDYLDGLSIDNLVELYQDIIEEMKDKNLHALNNDGHGGWINGHRYHWPGISKGDHPSQWFNDYHPNSEGYLRFLLEKGFDISTETQNYVTNTIMPQLRELTHIQLLKEWAATLYREKHPGYKYNELGVILETDKNKSKLP